MLPRYSQSSSVLTAAWALTALKVVSQVVHNAYVELGTAKWDLQLAHSVLPESPHNSLERLLKPAVSTACRERQANNVVDAVWYTVYHAKTAIQEHGLATREQLLVQIALIYRQAHVLIVVLVNLLLRAQLSAPLAQLAHGAVCRVLQAASCVLLERSVKMLGRPLYTIASIAALVGTSCWDMIM